ncbi:type I restriction enzyme HsdR N-terminal domain-containing protein [Richelia sinica FACHB-800]|nr:type I restriction enzyme HsdR N-terminal domain-containing protein [Richelia sinica FACHB-800]
MKTSHPDIIVTSPDGEYLMIVEVKLNNVSIHNQNAIEQLKRSMIEFGCSLGLLVAGERVTVLRDSFDDSHGSSIHVVGEAKLPNFLLPPADELWKENPYLEFESRVQRWLEKLKLETSIDSLPDDLRNLFGGWIINLLQLGEIRAAGPRWSKVTT